MITENEVFEIWEKLDLPLNVRKHCKAVQRKSLDIAKKLAEQGQKIDLNLVKIGSLLHDIGRAEEHSIKHGLLGYETLKKFGLEEKLCLIAKHHVGAGISKEEAVELGLPEQDYIPETIEEKIIAYADNLIVGDRAEKYETVLEEWKQKFGLDSEQVKRFGQLHNELKPKTEEQ